MKVVAEVAEQNALGADAHLRHVVVDDVRVAEDGVRRLAREPGVVGPCPDPQRVAGRILQLRIIFSDASCIMNIGLGVGTPLPT
jgi:hypothetical protein